MPYDSSKLDRWQHRRHTPRVRRLDGRDRRGIEAPQPLQVVLQNQGAGRQGSETMTIQVRDVWRMAAVMCMLELCTAWLLLSSSPSIQYLEGIFSTAIVVTVYARLARRIP